MHSIYKNNIMSLLKEIQQSLLDEESDLRAVLLKLKFLAAKLGSDVLEDWISHESEGYPDNVDVPDYRKIEAVFHGSFVGSYGREIKNVPIPNAIIKKFGGDGWSPIEDRDGIAKIESLLATSKTGTGRLEVDASDLIILLQGNIYPDFKCYHVTGEISPSSYANIQYIVRSRALELTLKIEKMIEGALDINVSDGPLIDQKDSDRIEQVTSQVIYGNVTNITNSGHSASITVNNAENDIGALKKALIEQGIGEEDSESFAQIVSQEKPSKDSENPLGDKAKKWILENLKKAADGTWKVGMATATKVCTEAALRYYGLK